MAVYHSSIRFLERESNTLWSAEVSNCPGLAIAYLDNADNGETETFLEVEPVYTDNYRGTRRIDYGAKYASVAVLNITFIKQNKEDFTSDELRDCFRWLNGSQQNSRLDICNEDGTVAYSYMGRFTNIQQHKLDSRTIGLVVEFTAISPFAYAVADTITGEVVGSKDFTITCDTDDFDAFVYMKTVCANVDGNHIIITNNSTGESSDIRNVAISETITIDSNLFITSDKSARTFGNDFNFVFPRLKYGKNDFTITCKNGETDATCNISFDYSVPVKAGNVIIN